MLRKSLSLLVCTLIASACAAEEGLDFDSYKMACANAKFSQDLELWADASQDSNEDKSATHARKITHGGYFSFHPEGGLPTTFLWLRGSESGDANLGPTEGDLLLDLQFSDLEQFSPKAYQIGDHFGAYIPAAGEGGQQSGTMEITQVDECGSSGTLDLTGESSGIKGTFHVPRYVP